VPRSCEAATRCPSWRFSGGRDSETGTVAGPMWRPRNAGVRGGTTSSNLLCSSSESGTNRAKFCDKAHASAACRKLNEGRDRAKKNRVPGQLPVCSPLDCWRCSWVNC
jgi:hypothetical protein